MPFVISSIAYSSLYWNSSYFHFKVVKNQQPEIVINSDDYINYNMIDIEITLFKNDERKPVNYIGDNVDATLIPNSSLIELSTQSNGLNNFKITSYTPVNLNSDPNNLVDYPYVKYKLTLEILNEGHHFIKIKESYFSKELIFNINYFNTGYIIENIEF